MQTSSMLDMCLKSLLELGGSVSGVREVIQVRTTLGRLSSTTLTVGTVLPWCLPSRQFWSPIRNSPRSWRSPFPFSERSFSHVAPVDRKDDILNYIYLFIWGGEGACTCHGVGVCGGQRTT